MDRDNNQGGQEIYRDFLLRSQTFDALLYEDESKDYEYFDPKFLPSNILFPAVLRILKTGSRAERIYIGQSDDYKNTEHFKGKGSDIDYNYEIGPGKVTEWTISNFFWTMLGSSSTQPFLLEPAENPGFYHIKNKMDGGYLYPRILKRKMAPMIKERDDSKPELFRTAGSIGKYLPIKVEENIKCVSNIKAEAAAKDTDVPLKSDNDEDCAIAMNLEKWPADVLKKFEAEGKASWFGDKETLQDALYLVPKNHPSSKHKLVEWRLTFSMVEKQLMLKISDVHRKAYLLCKFLLKKYCSKIQSYFLKTALMFKLDDWWDSDKSHSEKDLFELIKDIFSWLLDKHNSKFVPNYFHNEPLNGSDNKEGLAQLQNLCQNLHSHIEESFILFESVDVMLGRSQSSSNVFYKDGELILLNHIATKENILKLKDRSSIQSLVVVETYLGILDSLYEGLLKISNMVSYSSEDKQREEKREYTKQFEKKFSKLQACVSDLNELSISSQDAKSFAVSCVNFMFEFANKRRGFNDILIKISKSKTSYDASNDDAFQLFQRFIPRCAVVANPNPHCETAEIDLEMDEKPYFKKLLEYLKKGDHGWEDLHWMESDVIYYTYKDFLEKLDGVKSQLNKSKAPTKLLRPVEVIVTPKTLFSTVKEGIFFISQCSLFFSE